MYLYYIRVREFFLGVKKLEKLKELSQMFYSQFLVIRSSVEESNHSVGFVVAAQPKKVTVQPDLQSGWSEYKDL